MFSTANSLGPPPVVLTINGGSSSIRFSIHAGRSECRRLLAGKIDRIGLPGTALIVEGTADTILLPASLSSKHDKAVDFLLEYLGQQPLFKSVKAVGHRVVHGMQRSEPERITRRLLKDLHGIIPYAPDHLPREIALIEAFARRFPQLIQIACFDTAFHRSMPKVAKLMPIPRRYAEQGVERYGFHGLSYSYLIEELTRLDPVAAKGPTILAHLGNGASLAAVLGGKSIDTSMGFTPTAGLMMSNRTGDLDPGLVQYLARSQGMSAARFHEMVNRESGLLGVSEISSDMRDLLEQEARDIRAAEAVELFCYQAKKWIGSFAAVLGGVDTLVFAGGIGENSPQVRKRICEGLGFLGIIFSPKCNEAGDSIISTDTSRTKVRVIHTDEEQMIARFVMRSLPSL